MKTAQTRVRSWVCGSVFWLASGVAMSAGVDSEVTGSVKDKSGGALVGARVVILTPQRAVVATTSTDQAGKYRVTNLPDGPYLVIAQYPSLAETQLVVVIADGKPATLDLVLEVTSVQEDVTVTASPGALGNIGAATQPINVIGPEDILQRAKTVVAQAVEGETAVNLQRTSPGMAGIFVRGLTGNKVNVFVDGVRYSNGAQRGGVNTFLDMIDPGTLEGIEVLRGTSSAQYGSDALGGSIQFLTHASPLSSTTEPKLSGSMTVGGETGHRGGLGALSLAYARPKFGLSGSVTARKTGDYRPGTGDDSHAATIRFLGLPTSTFLDSWMPDTGFHQTGVQVRSNWLASPNLLVVTNYLSSRQDGANRWDQLLGGDGNLIAELNDLQLDLFYVRVESLSAGVFDRASATYSFNTQREERVNQGGNGNPAAAIAHEPERTTVHGVQFNASKQLSPRQALLVGGDMYFEGLTSESFNVDPVTGAISPLRPRVPDGATYHQSGFFGQLSFDAVPDRLLLTGAARVGFNSYEAKASDAPVVNGLPLWPDDSLDTTSATFRAGAALTVTPALTITTALSTGYRAPHMTDLGTLGLTGSGFEVAAPDLAGLEAFVGSTADATAVSTGRPVEQVDSETNINFDVGARYRMPKVRVEAGFFVNHIDGNIQKQSLILPPGAVGTTLGGQTITAQGPTGVVFVPLSTAPVLVRANFDKARIWGFEWLGEVVAHPDLTIGSTFTYMRAVDTTTDLPPNIEGGTPAPGGTIWARYMKSGRPWWVQPYFVFASEQTHLSTLDLGDRRTGATRSRANIQSFFRNGARARGWVNSGADGIANNADDILIATGETLAQVQDRVLGAGVNSAPLFTAVESYAAFGIRFGLRFGPHTIMVDAENLGDENYRGISWGMDAPGRGITARYVYRF